MSSYLVPDKFGKASHELKILCINRDNLESRGDLRSLLRDRLIVNY